jgi:hypothetical protein
MQTDIRRKVTLTKSNNLKSEADKYYWIWSINTEFDINDDIKYIQLTEKYIYLLSIFKSH